MTIDTDTTYAGDDDLSWLLGVLRRRHVPHQFDHDLPTLKRTLGLGMAHAVIVENGPMDLGNQDGYSVWMFGTEGRLLGVVHYKGGDHAS